MEKMKIIGMGNQGNFNYIIVKKSKDFFDWMSEITSKSFEHPYDTYDEYENNKGKWVRRKKQIKRYKDYHDTFFVEKNRLDLFFGDKLIFITLNTSKSVRKKFSDAMKENSKWIEHKKFYKRTLVINTKRKRIKHKD